MNKVKIVLLMASMVLAVIFTFSCSSNNSPELVAQSSGSEEATLSSSSEEMAQSSSSEWTAQSSSSEGTAHSSSSEWTVQSSSSEEMAQSSSSEGTSQSSSSEWTAQSSSSEGTAHSSSSEETAQSSSSEETTQSSSSEGTVQSSSSSSSSSSSGNTTFGTAGFWFLTTDEANDGTSTVGNAKDGDGNYIVLVQDGGNSVAKIQNYSLGRALYDAKMNQYPAYVDMSLSLKNNNEYKEILSCEVGFTYKYKGTAHIFRTKLSTVTDNNYHYATISASEDWKTAIIPIGDLKQESSGASIPFDFGRLDSLSWYLRDGLSSKTGDLAVYDVKCAANCDGKTYDPAMQFCYGNNIVDKCGGNEYDPATQFCENGSVKNKLKDSRDGKVYELVRIGGQTWMAENLNYNASGSKCYSNLESNCDTYGRLYDWSTAKTVCPSGWHLPSQAEWDVLGNDAKRLKATSGWGSGNGTDDYGFSALPGGYGFSAGSFTTAGNNGYWWSASEYNSNDAYYRYMSYNYDYANWVSSYKYNLYSVRCLQD